MVLTLPARAVMADCDGTLLESTAAQARAWSAWAKRHGVQPAAVLAADGLRARDKIERFAPHLDADAAVDEIANAELQHAHEVRALPGALELLTSPEPVAVVTSGTRALILARLAAAGLPRPSVLVTAEDVEAGKPAPCGYLLAAARLGREPYRCDVLEDTPVGVRAGLDAGARVYAVATTCARHTLHEAHAVVADVAEYLKLRAIASA